MHILHVVTSLPEGGLSRVVLDLSRQLKEKGHRVSICTTHAPGFHFAESVELWDRSFNWTFHRQLRKLQRLVALLRDGDFDIVHTHQEPVGSVAAGMARRAPVVETVHLLEWWQAVSPAPLRVLRRLCTARFAACSQEMYAQMLASRAAPKRKLCYVDNGIAPPNRPGPEAIARFRLELGVEDGIPIVGAAVRICEQKGVRYLIEAFAAVRRELPSVLVIVGDGDQRQAMELLARELGVEAHVRFLGYRRDATMLMAAFDVYVLPSLFEGLSTGLLEAMSFGMPIVATAVPSTVRVAGNCAVLVPPMRSDALAQAILDLLRDRRYAAALGKQAAERFQAAFTAERLAEDYLRIYDELLTNRH